MEPRFQSDDSPRLSTLVSGIVTDVRTLVRQELSLARTELKQDWFRMKNATTLFAGAFLLCFLGSAFACLALAQALFALGFPLGFAYTLIAALLIGVGILSYLLGRRWLKALTSLPEMSERLTEVKDRLSHPNVEYLHQPMEVIET